MSTLTTQEFEALRAYIESACSISLGVDKIYLVESRLKPLVEKRGLKSFMELYNLTKGPEKDTLRQQIIDAITTNETLWFRDKSPYEIFEDVFMPLALEKVRAGHPKIRIWSAACSTGQEPYSIAMVINAYCAKQGQGVLTPANFEIIATDISSQALAIARIGAYDKFTMGRGMEEAFMEKYFKQNQNYWIIDPMLKRMVTFKEFNLQEEFTNLGLFDIIFMRNVAIYFNQDFKVKLFEKVRLALQPKGMFIIGSTESLSYYTKHFLPKEHKRGVYYVDESK